MIRKFLYIFLIISLPLYARGRIDLTGGGGGSGSGAPDDATYITQSNNGTLSAERVITAGEGIDLADGGANSTMTVSGEDATSANKGIATFNTADFAVGAGDVTIKTDGVSDTQVDFGTGANQVSAVDIPIADGGGIITGTEVETALQENRTAIDLNTAKVTSKWEIDGSETQLISADEIDMQSKNIRNLLDPVNSQDAATKEYVDQAISFISTYFLNDTASDIGGIYFKMLEKTTGEVESTFTTAGLGAGADQALTNWATDPNIPGIITLKSGVYQAHLHAEKTAGTRTVNLYFEIYTRVAGGAETLRATSEVSGEITSKTDVTIHATVASDVVINDTDRIIVKWLGNIGASGSAVTVVLYAEGDNVSRLEVPTTTEVLSSVFVRQDGTTPLTADWDVGNFDLTLKSLTGDGTIEGATLTEGGNAVFSEIEDIAYTGANPLDIYGGDASGDDLMLHANTADSKSFIQIAGGDNIVLNVETGQGISFVANDTGFATFNATTATLTTNVLANRNLSISNSSTSAGVLTLLEDTDAGTNFASFQVPPLTANTVYLLPVDDGDNTEVLQTNGSGTLEWVANAGGGGAFSDAGDPIVQNTTTKDVHMGDGAGTLAGKVEIGGDANQPQLVIEGHSAQTDDILIIQNDADAEVFSVSKEGNVTVAGTVDGVDIATRDHAATVAGDLDHGGINGLGDDDHSAYENELNNSAGLRAALSDETGGTGVAVFNTNPTLTGALLAGILADNDDMVFEIDANNDGSNKYSWTDGVGAEIMSLTEPGVLTVSSTVSALTGNASTATALATGRDIGGSSFDGTANIDILNVTVADTADATSFVGLFESATGAALAPKTDGGLTYNAGTATLAATTFTGAVTGSSTETASNADWTVHDSYPAACNAGEYINALGDTSTCTDATTEINSVVNGLGGTNLTCAAQNCDVDDAFLKLGGDVATAGTYDFGSASVVLEIPNSAAPTTDAAGEIALDTTIVDHQPLYQYFDGGENMTIIAIDTSELPAQDNEIPKYDAATNKFVLEADVGAGAEVNNLEVDGAADIATTEIFVGNAPGAGVYAAISNDCTMDNTGAITCDHDALDNFVADEHLNWKNSVDTIHTDNYIEEATTGGRSTTLNGSAIDADPETFVAREKISFEDPTATDDFFFGEVAVTSTWTSIYCKTLVGTVDLDVTIGGADINGTDITCSTSGVLDASLAGDTAGVIGEEVKLAITSVASSPTYLMVILNGTYDD